MLTRKLLVIGPRPLIFEKANRFSIISHQKLTENQKKRKKETVKGTKRKKKNFLEKLSSPSPCLLP